jgi:D-glycero-D-manno-heptose 1,7-bisphosphate phosphatase
MPIERAVFLDRDGVVNERLPDAYVRRWEEFRFIPAIFGALPRLRLLGYRTVLVTNQQGIAKGLMTMGDLTGIHERMQRELGEGFDAIEVCAHGALEGCDCRKPRPGMITRAARRMNIDLARSWMVGDTESDVDAGNAAGCRTVLIDDRAVSTSATFRCATLDEAVEVIAAHGEEV